MKDSTRSSSMRTPASQRRWRLTHCLSRLTQVKAGWPLAAAYIKAKAQSLLACQRLHRIVIGFLKFPERRITAEKSAALLALDTSGKDVSEQTVALLSSKALKSRWS